jgi:hypothetical protein
MTLIVVLAIAAGALYWDSKRANPLVWGKLVALKNKLLG